MKKVLSVLLAAAMVMGMSVSAAALTFESTTDVINTSDSNEYKQFGPQTSKEVCYHGTDDEIEAGEIEFKNWLFINGVKYTNAQLKDAVLNPGDVLTFVPVVDGDTLAIDADEVDCHWSINVKGAEYVESVKFGNASTGTLVINVTVAKELDNLDEQEVTLKMYIADNYSKATNKQSEGIKVVMAFDNYKEEYVSYEYTNDVDYVAKWIVAANAKKGTAVFDFEDEAYFTVKMIPEEEVILNFVSGDYVKAIDKAFDYEANYTYYNFKGESDEFTYAGELFIPAEEDTFIYAWDGEALVEIEEAEWVKEYKVDGMTKKGGWVIETNELGYYVVSDIEAEIEAEEVEAEVEAEKANPETGAADFVGAAVAMAVVSVAAAGALALKK